jgi:hypothetical protein
MGQLALQFLARLGIFQEIAYRGFQSFDFGLIADFLSEPGKLRGLEKR